jgi:hypothetical protein
MTSSSGHDPAEMVQCRVIAVNMTNWTVDVRSQYDRHFYADIQVASMYQHYNNGEGFSCMPEVGADCMVAIPSDSSPPFVMGFIMPMESFDTSAPDAPQGTGSHPSAGRNANTASFAGGRPKANPGDMIMRTRDGNFVILRRGGVLQLGANSMSQRIYIPIGNIITDICEQYNMHNVMGSINWGIQEGPTQQNIPGQWTQVFRVNADDKYADVRVRVGKVTAIGEPASGDGEDLGALGIGTDGPVVYEVVVAPGGFTEDGSPSSTGTVEEVKMRFFFDRLGGTFLRSEGSALFSFKKKLKLKIKEEFELVGEKSGTITFKTGLDIDGGAYTAIKGKVIRLASGKKKVARAGDVVQCAVLLTPINSLLVAPPGGGPVTGTLKVTGIIMTGSPEVLA